MASRNTFHLINLFLFFTSPEKAYAALIYLRSIYEDGRIDVNLVASKTKVVALKSKVILGNMS